MTSCTSLSFFPINLGLHLLTSFEHFFIFEEFSKVKNVIILTYSDKLHFKVTIIGCNCTNIVRLSP